MERPWCALSLGHLVEERRFRSLEIRAVDGTDVPEAVPEILQRAGFQ